MNRHELIRVQPLNIKQIEIGDDVWMGADSRILMGARIPTGTVIAANSVVLKNKY